MMATPNIRTHKDIYGVGVDSEFFGTPSLRPNPYVSMMMISERTIRNALAELSRTALYPVTLSPIQSK